MTENTNTGTPGNSGTPAPGDAAAAAAAAAAAQPAWYAGKADAETIGHLENRIAKGDDAVTAAIKLAKSHMEATRLLGVPTDRILKLPANTEDKAGWDAIYQKLGAPAKAEEYKFDGIKFADGTDLDEGFSTFARKTAGDLHLSVNGAKQFTQELVKYMDAAEASDVAEMSARITSQKEALAKNWGTNFQANQFIASQAAQRLGFTKEHIDGLEKLVGYDKIMEAFRVVGTKMGEDVFVQGHGQTSGGVMTRDQAVTRLTELKADTAWVERYMAGGAKEKQEMFALQTLINARQQAA